VQGVKAEVEKSQILVTIQKIEYNKIVLLQSTSICTLNNLKLDKKTLSAPLLPVLKLSIYLTIFFQVVQ
jgi:hypothetical protein